MSWSCILSRYATQAPIGNAQHALGSGGSRGHVATRPVPGRVQPFASTTDPWASQSDCRTHGSDRRCGCRHCRPGCQGSAHKLPYRDAHPVIAQRANRGARPDIGQRGAAASTRSVGSVTLHEFPVPRGSRPHDVAPSPDGSVWYTAQATGELGRLDPSTGATRHVKLGQGSAPHGVIVGPDGGAWVTDGGLNAIVRVDNTSEAVEVFKLPGPNANLNTATFDGRGVLWFTGQSGYHGRLDPRTGRVEVWDSPRGRGPYGIATTPDGEVYFVSLAGNYLGRIDLDSGAAAVLDPPTPQQGARRVWSDSRGNLWISEWNVGKVARYSPASGEWREWPLPGSSPRAYSVYVDEQDGVWLSDFASNTMVRFNPTEETFDVFQIPSPTANVRQMLGRPGEVWGAESGQDKLLLMRLEQSNALRPGLAGS
jgi:virginiamycin B lyase